jgi:Lon protease-like protein
VSARLAELLPLPLALKQELLEADGPARLERLNGILKRAA